MKLSIIILLSTFFVALFFNSVAGTPTTKCPGRAVTETVTKTTTARTTTATCPGKTVSKTFTITNFSVKVSCLPECPHVECHKCPFIITSTTVICTTSKIVISKSSCCPPKSPTPTTIAKSATAKSVSPKATAKGKRR